MLCRDACLWATDLCPATLCELQPNGKTWNCRRRPSLIARQGVRYITAADLAVMDSESARCSLRTVIHG